MRERIAEIPDGTYQFSDTMDSDGVDEGALTLDVKMIVKGTNITFDLSGSSPECRGPFNSPYSNTVTGTMIAIKHVFWDVAHQFRLLRALRLDHSRRHDAQPAAAAIGLRHDD